MEEDTVDSAGMSESVFFSKVSGLFQPQENTWPEGFRSLSRTTPENPDVMVSEKPPRDWLPPKQQMAEAHLV